MTILIFLIVLAILVFVHELGHFTAAKFFGVRVDEFALGFPPRILGFKKGETNYVLNMIPFGGYVKIFGENPEEVEAGADMSRSFQYAAKWKQGIILLSGVFMNLVFAWILISTSFFVGVLADASEAQNGETTHVVIVDVREDSPAEAAGLRAGDIITGISSGTNIVQAGNIQDVQTVIAESEEKLTVSYTRGGVSATTSVLAILGEQNRKVIGIAMAEGMTKRYGFFASLGRGAVETVYQTKHVATGIYSFIIRGIRGEDGILDQVAGPVGIASMMGQVREIGISYVFSFIALISINLAVLNAVPFPAFDGGRFLFVVIESITRKNIKPAILVWANGLGLIMLLGLMVLITYKDIMRLFQ